MLDRARRCARAGRGRDFKRSTGGWAPDGDDAWVARRTQQVFTLDPPLVGQDSTAGEAASTSGLSHPGPVQYYLMAVPYRLAGWSPIGLARDDIDLSQLVLVHPTA